MKIIARLPHLREGTTNKKAPRDNRGLLAVLLLAKSKRLCGLGG
jgi:hypothetical protein